MPVAVQVGTILLKDWPLMTQLVDLKTKHYSGDWKLVESLDRLGLDRQIRALRWNFFFMEAEVKAMFFGALGEKKIYGAMKRILAKVKQQHFNSLEVTRIVAKHFLGIPYVIVSAHSRHIQQPCYLDSYTVRADVAARC